MYVVHVSNGCAVVNDSFADFGGIQTAEQCCQVRKLIRKRLLTFRLQNDITYLNC